jgi:predicted ribosomally synthesized peptide with SipW-like signal peptide
MKKKNKVLLTSMATIAMCASLVAGGTYALFTSESAVNVAVTSGTVSVVATLDDKIELGSTLGENVAETTVEYSTESNTIALSNMLPGDYIEFDINVHNASTVSVKYQTVISVVEDDGLFGGLEVSIDNEEIKGKDAKMSKWETLAVGSDDIIVPVRVELPDDRGNDFQGKTCTIAYTVNAVQGNAATYDPVPEAAITDLTEDQKLVQSSEISPYVSGLVADGATLEVVAGQSYSIGEALSEINTSQYKDWIADFEVSFNKDITYTFASDDSSEIIPTAADLFLIGEYGSLGWIPVPVVAPALVGKVEGVSGTWDANEDGVNDGYYTVTLEAEKSVRALGDLLTLFFQLQSGNEDVEVAFTYQMIADFVGTFNCGIVLDGSAMQISDGVPPTGTVVTVELKLYEAESYAEMTEDTVIKTVDTYKEAIQQKVEDQADLSAALGKGLDVELGAGSYTMPSVSGKEFAVSGTEDTVIKVEKPNMTGTDVTFNGVTVQGSGIHTGVQHVNTVTYNDVTIKGEMCLYGEKVVFNNCTFELAAGQYLWTYGAEEVEFNNCTFNTAGKSILIYKDGDATFKQTVTVKDCTFNATTSGYAGAVANQACAAIELHNYNGIGLTLNLEGTNKVDDDFSGLWRIKEDVQTSPAITVNGVTYREEGASVFLDGVAYTIDANKNVTKK